MPEMLRARQKTVIERRRPPETMEVDPLLEVQRISERDYLREGPEG